MSCPGHMLNKKSSFICSLLKKVTDFTGDFIETFQPHVIYDTLKYPRKMQVYENYKLSLRKDFVKL